MLAWLKQFSVRFFIGMPLVFGLVVPILARCAESPQYDMRTSHCYYDHFIEYFNSIDQNTDLDEIIDNLILLRRSMLSQGLYCPILKELCLDMLAAMYGKHVYIEPNVLDEFLERIELREIELSRSPHRPQIGHVGHHKKKHKDRHDKGAKIGSKGVFGIVKMLAGGLIAILPIPGAQTVGLGLIIYGVNELVDCAREQGDENEREQKAAEQRRREAEMLAEPVLP